MIGRDARGRFLPGNPGNPFPLPVYGRRLPREPKACAGCGVDFVPATPIQRFCNTACSGRVGGRRGAR